MKIMLFSLGTRGDIEPFLAIAQRLHARGDKVVCAFPVQFGELVDQSKYAFHGLSEKFLELIEGEKAKLVLGGRGSIFKKLGALSWMIRTSGEMQKEVIAQQHALIEQIQPDRVIYNQKCLYPVVWGMKNKGKTTLLSPLPCTIHPYEEHAALGMGKDMGKLLNTFTYRFSNFFLFNTISRSTKKFQKAFGINLSTSAIKHHVLNGEKMIYTISPSLFSKPAYWNENVHVVGYHEREAQSAWQASPALESFVKTHTKIVFITFGSMTNPEPEEVTSAIVKVLSKHKIPAILNTASGGLKEPEEAPEHVFFTRSLPYAWILPKVYATVHHGGAGTVHTSLKYGCASLIIPHILDQHIWNDLLPQLGVGPAGVSIKKFSEKTFEPLLLKLLSTSAYKENALRLSEKLKAEDLEDYLLSTITEDQAIVR